MKQENSSSPAQGLVEDNGSTGVPAYPVPGALQGVLGPNTPIIFQVVPSHGRHGDPIKILGGRFGNSTANISVTFDGVRAEIIQIEPVGVDEGIIHTIVANGASTGELQVVVNGEPSEPAYFQVDWVAQKSWLGGTHVRALCIDQTGIIYVTEVDKSGTGIHEVNGLRPVIAFDRDGLILGSADGITVDPSENLITTDALHNKINKTWYRWQDPAHIALFAGSGIRGFKDGFPDIAQFSEPRGVAADGVGNFYVADVGNNRIRKISPGGLVSTIAGSGNRGYLDATNPLDAEFQSLYGICVDLNGSVYITDANRIRKIDGSGGVTTIAGQAQAGYVNGSPSLAEFNAPKGIAIGPDGFIYVADTGNDVIRQISTNGLVTTVSHGFHAPTGITVRGTTFDQVHLYVLDKSGLTEITFS